MFWTAIVLSCSSTRQTPRRRHMRELLQEDRNLFQSTQKLFSITIFLDELLHESCSLRSGIQISHHDSHESERRVRGCNHCSQQAFNRWTTPNISNLITTIITDLIVINHQVSQLSKNASFNDEKLPFNIRRNIRIEKSKCDLELTFRGSLILLNTCLYKQAVYYPCP